MLLKKGFLVSALGVTFVFVGGAWAADKPLAVGDGVHGNSATAALSAVRWNPAASGFAAVVRKKGLAAALAHNHLIAATAPQFEGRAAPNLSAAVFTAHIPLKTLRVDDPAEQKKWFPWIKQLNILQEPFSALSDKDRTKISENMHGEKQLNTQEGDELTVTATLTDEPPPSKAKKDFQWGSWQPSHVLDISVTLKGRTSTGKGYAEIVKKGSQLNAKAIAAVNFSDFGITPFSALLGAIQNQDQFFILADLGGTL